MEQTKQKGWIIFSIDNTQMAIAQDEVKQIIEIASLMPSLNNQLWSTIDGWSVLRTNQKLELSSGDSRRFALMIEALKQPIGLLCDKVKIMGTEQKINIVALPPIFSSFKKAASGFLQLGENDIATILDSTSLGILLEDLEAQNGTN